VLIEARARALTITPSRRGAGAGDGPCHDATSRLAAGFDD
jgi:hypothetical protein